MGRNFDGTDGEVDLGDITNARFLQGDTWTAMVFFRSEGVGHDDQCLISKIASAGTTQLLWRIDQNNPNAEVYFANLSINITGSADISTDTWYLAALTNDGTGGANGARCLILNMDGTSLSDDTGDHEGNNADLTSPVTIGRTAANSDEMDGDMAWAIYVDAELTTEEITAYLYDPVGEGLRLKAEYGLQFWLPLFGSGSTEIDWSGNGNDGTVTGTTTTGEDPPQQVVIFPYMGHAPQAGAPAYDPGAQLAAGELALIGSGGMIGAQVI